MINGTREFDNRTVVLTTSGPPVQAQDQYAENFPRSIGDLRLRSEARKSLCVRLAGAPGGREVFPPHPESFSSRRVFSWWQSARSGRNRKLECLSVTLA